MAAIRLTKSQKRQTRKATKTPKTQAPEFSLAPLSPKTLPNPSISQQFRNTSKYSR